MRISRQWIGRTLLAAIFIAATTCLILKYAAPQSQFRHSPDADFQPQVYLWQRAWTNSVRRALQRQSTPFARIVVLARQIDFGKTVPHVTSIAVDWHALKATGTPIAAAIRIGFYTGPFDGPSSDALLRTARSVIADAAAANLTLAEIQIDFDAPTSKLAGYRLWLANLRKTTGPIPVTLTALPTWLNSPAFAGLAHDAGYFVLQVHWLEHPHNAGDPLVLCDLPTARRAIDKAAALHVPFRVALPTYGYVAAFNADGSFAGMAAENAPPDWGQNKNLRLVEANPDQLALFVNEFAGRRPMSMRGFIWYRLPLDTDRLNWSWPTLQAVMASHVPPPGKLAVTCRQTASNLYDIDLQNVGLRDIDPACRIHLDWPAAQLVSADALANFQITTQSNASLDLVSPPTDNSWQSRLKPHESRTIAWLRLDKETSLHASLQQNLSPLARNPGPRRLPLAPRP